MDDNKKVDFKTIKDYRFRLCNFLIEQRNNYKDGVKNTVSFKLKDFPKFDEHLIDEENMKEFKKDMEQLLDEEVEETGKPPIKIINNDILKDLDSLVKSYQNNEEIKIKYKRKEIESFLSELSGLSSKQKSDSKNKPLENLPENFGWADVEIKFIDENKIAISIKGKFITSGDHKKFGFAKNKDKVPNISWELLKKLSVLLDYEDEEDKKKDWKNKKDKINKANDELVNRKINPTKYQLKKFFQSRNPLAKELKEETVEKHKSNLDKALRQLFSLSGISAFYDYSQYGYYRPIFTLRPYTILRDNNSEPGFDKTMQNINEETFRLPKNLITSKEEVFYEVDNNDNSDNM
jgi:hypothetical protein